MPKIKNYTSTVPVSRTISRIEEHLAEIGATHIAKEYQESKVTGITFSLPFQGRHPAFRIPAQPEVVYEILTKGKRIQARSRDSYREQALRTAWKIVADWVEVQCAMVQLKQAEPMQVFFSCLLHKGETVYQKFIASGGKLLGSGE
jgi:hypothetical protein